MVFIGHLDMIRTFVRASRRAELPVSADGSSYHARPQIISCLALSLGATSACEIVDIYLTERRDSESVRSKLQVISIYFCYQSGKNSDKFAIFLGLVDCKKQ